MITWKLLDRSSTSTIASNIKVYLNDINDELPVFKEILYTFYLPEDSTDGVVVDKVSATDRDSGANGEIKYSLSPDSEGLNVFEMLEDGTLIVNDSTSLDYETTVDYALEAIATDLGTPSLSANPPARIRVLIEDVNDVPPEFKHLPYSVEIPENQPEETSVITIDAIDGDKGVQDKNSILYTLINDISGHFGINNTSGDIYITRPIDKENMTGNSYTLDVQATEEITGQTNTAEVLVTILDENDNLPVFNPTNVTYNLDENTPRALIYLDMTVSDADDTGNNKFSFTLEGGNGTFKLNKPGMEYTSETTVVLVAVELLDFEAGATSISVKVIATEAQNKSRQSFGDVVIQIIDLNDNYPEFANETYQAYIPEDAVAGAHVITIVATDKDALTKYITYGIIGTGLDNTCFNVFEHTGMVTVSGECEFDIEEGKSSYFFTYQAKDDGGLASTVLLEISLTDVNDNHPVHVSTTPESPTIPESQNGQFKKTHVAIIQFTDADNDENTNGRVEYSMNGSSIFRINETTGRIYQTEDADFETKKSYEFLVIAEDKGTPSLSSNISITIEVEDVNDNAPIFINSTYEGEVNETAGNGEFILTVIATDADSLQNQQIDYAWLSSGDGISKFSVDQINGNVIKNGELDWDKGPTEYNLTVIAKDRGEPPLNGTCIVRIKVLDTNDEAPVLKEEVVDIREDANVSEIVTVIKANDSDTNSKLEYGILLVEAFNDLGAQVKDYHNDHFKLENSTGELMLTHALDQEVVQEYQLTVQVEDLNSITGPQKDSATIKINVLDVPDEQPKFREKDDPPVIERVAIVEDVEGERHNDSCITNVSLASDKDENDPIFYFIVDGNEECVFHLENSTGCVTVVKSVNRETAANYTLIVKASNNMYYKNGQKCPAEESSGARILEATDPVFDPETDPTLIQVAIQIVDVNDNPPVFSPDVYTAGASSTYNYGTSIIQLVAKDEDVGVNAEMEYEIVEEAYYIDDVRQETIKKYFAVDKKTGWITLSSIFNSEDEGYFELDVIVVGTGNLIDKASVSIYLMNPSIHQVKVVFVKASDVVYNEREEFTKLLLEGTNYVINIDETKVHLDEYDVPDTTRTDMRIHGVNATINSVIESRQLIRAIDEAYTIYADLKNTFRVMQVVKAVPDPDPVFDTLNALQWFFFTLSLLLIFILSLWAIAFVFWRSSLQRKLRVANAEIYRKPKDIHKEKLPNTNLYQQEGSNPLYKTGLIEKNNRVHAEADKSSVDETWKNSDEGIDTLKTNEVEDAKNDNSYKDLAIILNDYDQSVGIDNPGNDIKVHDNKDAEDLEVTDV
ncbi:protocadherin Fat 4-like isoform X2 [Anneissia japonica]|uniref:protocadherin Fat 4-like isoform X2 n=1 Tax=Anneissia japonica TaxID=1529436 RepID=UPI001425971D|nr:protocadherin Fat 4-like isoform X2 [Anneissia japonica]